MSRTRLTLIALVSAGAALSFAGAGPASAQSENEKINQLIVYGEDPCPASTGEQITVCARKSEGERFRIPEALREGRSPQNEAWNNRVIAYETVGRSGTLSCSPVGGGGWSGCVNQMIATAYAEKKDDPSVRFGELIAAERARRLSTIDTEAKVTQGEVEEAERAHDERLKAEREAREAGK